MVSRHINDNIYGTLVSNIDLLVTYGILVHLPSARHFLYSTMSRRRLQIGCYRQRCISKRGITKTRFPCIPAMPKSSPMMEQVVRFCFDMEIVQYGVEDERSTHQYALRWWLLWISVSAGMPESTHAFTRSSRPWQRSHFLLLSPFFLLLPEYTRTS